MCIPLTKNLLNVGIVQEAIWEIEYNARQWYVILQERSPRLVLNHFGLVTSYGDIDLGQH